MHASAAERIVSRAALGALSLGAALVLQEGLPAASPPPSAAAPRGSVSFLVIGDWGRRSDCQEKTASRMAARGAGGGLDFVVAAGDNFYSNGVAGVDDAAWREVFEEPYGDPALQVPWYAVLGNHDYRGSTGAQIAYSSRSPRWRMPARYYSFERAVDGETSCLFVFLDTTALVKQYRLLPWFYPDLASQDGQAQLRWLEETLAASSARWKIVVGHHPVYSGGAMHGPTRELVDSLRPLLERHGVQAYFSGHEHNLQLIAPGGATRYVVSGSAALPRAAGREGDPAFTSGACGFVAARLERDSLRLEFVDGDGKVLHRAVVPPGAERP